MDFPEPIEKKTKGPKRGSHASAKRFRKKSSEKSGDKSKPAPQGRGKFAKPKRKPNVGAAGKPGGKYQGKFSPRGQGRSKK